MPVLSKSYCERRYAEAGWSRSKKGNLWMHWEFNNTNYTVFQDVHGAFKICVFGPYSGPEYVAKRFATEWQAFKAAEQLRADEIEEDDRDANCYGGCVEQVAAD